MKSFKVLLVGAFVFALLTPVFVGGVVKAQVQIDATPLMCVLFNGEFTNFESDGCDLAIQKEVSVNGGVFVDANNGADAAQAAVGDNVVWRISVTNPSVPDDGYVPNGGIRVADALPAGFTYNSSTSTDGTYDDTTDTWQFTVGFSTTYPVVLTINSTAASAGLFENVATLFQYGDEGWDTYVDASDSNNTESAFVNISGAPVVLGESTPVVLAATGNGMTESLVAGTLILTTFGLLGYSRFARKES